MGRLRSWRLWLVGLVCVFSFQLDAQTRRAEGVVKLPEGSTVAVMPMDIDLYSRKTLIFWSGPVVPHEDWTEQARKSLTDALVSRSVPGERAFKPFPEPMNDTVAEVAALYDVVSWAIYNHHFSGFTLPTKGKRLDWSIGPAAGAIAQVMPADYAIFLCFVESTTQGGLGATGFGKALLADLKTGRVVWYNQMLGRVGDARDPEKAKKVLDKLFQDFPE
jgi:hypothetical protein